MRIMRASEQIDGGRTIEADTTPGHTKAFLEFLKSQGFTMPKDAGIPGMGGEMDDMLYEFFGGNAERISDVSAYLLEDWDNFAYGSKTASDRTFSEWKADHYPDVDLVDCSRMERSKIMNEYEEYSGGNGTYAKKTSFKKTAFMDFNPSLKHRHLVAGWDWDESLNGYVASGDQGHRHFECSCGAKVASPGMASCDCGKVWNSYTVTSSDKNFMVCREVPRRDVLLANRRI